MVELEEKDRCWNCRGEGGVFLNEPVRKEEDDVKEGKKESKNKKGKMVIVS